MTIAKSASKVGTLKFHLRHIEQQPEESTMTKPKFTIIFSNPGGELDRRTARTEASCKAAVVELAESVAYFCDGDTIRVIERDD